MTVRVETRKIYFNLKGGTDLSGCTQFPLVESSVAQPPADKILAHVASTLMSGPVMVVAKSLSTPEPAPEQILVVGKNMGRPHMERRHQ